MDLLEDVGDSRPAASLELRVQDLLNILATLSLEDLNFKCTESHSLNLIINNSRAIVCAARTSRCHLIFFDLLILLSRNGLYDHLDQRILLPDGTLQSLGEDLVLLFIVLGRSIVLVTVNAIIIRMKKINLPMLN